MLIAWPAPSMVLSLKQKQCKSQCTLLSLRLLWYCHQKLSSESQCPALGLPAPRCHLRTRLLGSNGTFLHYILHYIMCPGSKARPPTSSTSARVKPCTMQQALASCTTKTPTNRWVHSTSADSHLSYFPLRLPQALSGKCKVLQQAAIVAAEFSSACDFRHVFDGSMYLTESLIYSHEENGKWRVFSSYCMAAALLPRT